MSKVTKFTKPQLYVIAALFARSNTGMDLPKAAELRRMMMNASPLTTLGSAVVGMCEPYMETNEHQRMFMDEAKMWMRDKKLATLESIAKVWPDMSRLIADAMKPHKSGKGA
jgi:hypothetical protein